MSSDSIGFIGGGNMTRAIAGGLISSGVDASHVFIAEPVAEQRKTLADELVGATIHAHNEDVAAIADSLVLSVKPQVLANVCNELRSPVQDRRPLIISIAAGVRSVDIDSWLGGGLAVIRVMPNQPALLGRGVSGIYANTRSNEAERERARSIMAAVGEVVDVPTESAIDAVTAVSGSGPAYFFLLIDMLTEIAEELGLTKETAITLAVETAKGAAALADNGESMRTLIARVRSPGGTTATALDSLEADGIRDIFTRAVTAARDRAIELADRVHADN